MTIDLTQIIVALIGLLATVTTTVITACIVPYFRAKLTATQYETVKFWTKTAVEAAEKIYFGTGMGSEKKEYVKQFLVKKGFTLNDDEITAMIESAVLEMQNAFIN